MSKPIYDLTYLKEVTDNDADAIKELAEMFVDETPGIVENIRHSIAGENHAEFTCLTHKLKSTLRVFGLTSLSERYAQIELHSKTESEREVAVELFFKSIAEVEEAVEAIKTDFGF